jgi:hypothetical protein
MELHPRRQRAVVQQEQEQGRQAVAAIPAEVFHVPQAEVTRPGAGQEALLWGVGGQGLLQRVQHAAQTTGEAATQGALAVCLQGRQFTHTRQCTHSCARMHTHTHMHERPRMHARTYTHTHTHAHTRIHTRMHTHTHTHA